MKLYLYDHCPFCVRADMVANYKQVAHEKVYLLNDDEKSCFDLIGAKMVPILQFDDGKAMGESLDIVQKLDELGSRNRPLQPGTDIQALLAQIGEVGLAVSCLLFPRNIAIGLPEFATQSARDYFEVRKAAIIKRPFAQALKETPTHKAAIENMLAALPPLPAAAGRDGVLGRDDVLLHPTLRNLTMVKDLVIPAQVRAYIDSVAALTSTHTYFDRAI